MSSLVVKKLSGLKIRVFQLNDLSDSLTDMAVDRCSESKLINSFSS